MPAQLHIGRLFHLHADTKGAVFVPPNATAKERKLLNVCMLEPFWQGQHAWQAACTCKHCPGHACCTTTALSAVCWVSGC